MEKDIVLDCPIVLLDLLHIIMQARHWLAFV